MTVGTVGSLAVSHEPASAARIRAAIAADLEQRAIAPCTVADVVLVASELVGNAVVHTPSTDDVDVSWDIDTNCVTISVVDDGTDEPQVLDASSTASHGRGLAIVSALADDWGVTRDAHGKRVWAQVPLNDPA